MPGLFQTLTSARAALRRPFARFRRREDGAVTVEAVLWVPFFFVILITLADAALIFYGQASALRVAQDVTRAFSVGEISNNLLAAEAIESDLEGTSPNAEAEVAYNDGIITTRVTIPASDLAAVGFFTSLTTFEMNVVTQIVREN